MNHISMHFTVLTDVIFLAYLTVKMLRKWK